MSLNPLAPVSDYQSMKNRIFWFTLAATLAAIWLLRRSVPAIDLGLGQIDFAVEMRNPRVLPIPGGYLIPALAVAIAARVFRLHARVSDWLGIRESFDITFIIGEFANQLTIDLKSVDESKMRSARNEVMRSAFYRFVNGSQPQVDAQLIHQALESWSWFWVGVEAIVVFTLTGFGSIAFNAYQEGLLVLAGAGAIAAIGLPSVHRQCARYARAQVRSILADPKRAADVRAVLHSLLAKVPDRRLAA